MYPLWFAALPLALVPWVGFFRPHALRYSAVDAVKAGLGARGALSALSPLLSTAVLALVVVALARPQKVQRETVVESDGIDIMLAIDTSGSMESPDMGARGSDLTRLDAGKLVMKRFVDERPHDRVGLLAFGQEAFIEVPLTLDHDALVEFIGDLEIGAAGKAATAVGTAIAVASKHMKELKAPTKVVILVTDGRSNAGSVTPLQAADAAAALGIKVYTIGVGSVSGNGGLFGSLFGGAGADVDEPTLSAIATTTGARYYRATDAQALQKVYDEIDQLEKSTAQVKEFVHRDELYLGALLPAIGLFVLERLLVAGPLRRLP